MKFKIYLGNMEAITVEASSLDEVEAILLDNAKTFLKDLLDEGAELFLSLIHISEPTRPY